MKVLATSLGVLALAATLGLVAAQDRPAQKPEPAPRGARPRRPGEGGRRQGHHRTARLFRQGVQREGRQGARRPVHAGRRDRGRGRRCHPGPRRHRRPVHGDLQGKRRRYTRRGHRLPAFPRDATSPSRRAPRPLDRGGTPRGANRYSVIYARQGGRWLHARVRDEPEETSPPTTGSGSSNGCSASGSTRATTRWSIPPASGQTTATSCSGTST